MNNYIIVLFIGLSVWLQSCKDKSTSQADKHTTETFNELIEYAEHLSIRAFDHHFIVRITNPWMQGDTTQIVLQKKVAKPAIYMRNSKNLVRLNIPVNSMALTATTQLAMVQEVSEIDKVKGLSGTKYVYNMDAQNRIDDGFIQEIGNPNGGINVETLIELNPEITLVYGIDENDAPSLQKIKDAGLTTIMFSEFTELHPLGRAEWIKLIGILTGRQNQAITYFNDVKQEYHRLQELTRQVDEKQTTFTGISWKDSWVVPGGKSYVGQFLLDAGSAYLWSNTEESGSLHLSFESAFEKAVTADVWLNPGMARSIDDVSDRNELFRDFKSVLEKRVYNNTKRVSENGGYDFWESGVIKPHLVLADLIKIFHPELAEDHEFYFYEELQ